MFIFLAEQNLEALQATHKDLILKNEKLKKLKVVSSLSSNLEIL